MMDPTKVETFHGFIIFKPDPYWMKQIEMAGVYEPEGKLEAWIMSLPTWLVLGALELGKWGGIALMCWGLSR